MPKFRSMMITLLFALGLSFVNLFANVGFVAAAPQNPPKPVVSYESLQDEPVAGADAETATFKLHAVMMGSGDARLIMENVQGSGVLTGTLTTEGKAAFDFSVDLKNAPYPGVVIARAFAPKGQDVNWKVFYNGVLILDQTSTPFKGVVHLWAELNPANTCEVNGFYQEDPGIDAQVDQQAPVHQWYSASKGSFGTFVVTTDGWHELKATAGRSKDLEADGTFSDKRGKLSYKWFANCGPKTPPTKESAECLSLTPAHVALKPGEQVLFTLTGSKVVTYSIELDGQQVSTANTYTFNADAVGSHKLTGKVAGEDGQFNTAAACNAEVVVSENPPPPVLTCDYIDPQIAALQLGQSKEFTLVGTNASRYQFRAGDQVLSNTDKYTFNATAVGTFDLQGFVAGTNGDFITGSACVARIVVTQTPPPPTGGRDRMWTTSFPILSCDALPQYNNENVWVRGLMLVHINAENRPAGENWDVYNAQFSAEGRDASQLIDAGATRLVGIESRSITTTLDVAVIWNVRQNSPDSPSTYGQTHAFNDTLVGVNPLNYNDVRAKGFNIPVPGKPGQYFGPARKGTKADEAYKWAYDVNIERCKVQPTIVPPHNPDSQQISVCTGLNADGSKHYDLFDLGKEPAEAASCKEQKPSQKNFCSKINGVNTTVTIDSNEEIPVHLPCTLGEIDENEANMLVAAQNAGAMTAALLPLAMLVGFALLLVVRRRHV